MYSSVIRDYGDESSFEIDETLPLPELKSNQVLVKISASSVNPIDLMKREGYGRSIFEKQRRNNFPWILGSDFSGHVVSVGQKVTRFKEGDEVWGCTSKASSGTYAEYAAIDQEEVNIKPKNLTFEESVKQYKSPDGKIIVTALSCAMCLFATKHTQVRLDPEPLAVTKPLHI